MIWMRRGFRTIWTPGASRTRSSLSAPAESNFLLWQCAYAEFYYTDTLWPDFDEAELDRAIAAYHSRDRRFGGAK